MNFFNIKGTFGYLPENKFGLLNELKGDSGTCVAFCLSDYFKIDYRYDFHALIL
jgi:hypothetical protein